jgi:hypothetical protein
VKVQLSCLAMVALCACSSDDWQPSPGTAPAIASPTIDAPLSSGSAWLWGMVVDGSGVCIPSGIVEVLRGQSAGHRIIQATPCGAWDAAGGFTFMNLRSGVAMTIRASAPGYIDVEKTVVPTLGPQTAFLFELKPVTNP